MNWTKKEEVLNSLKEDGMNLKYVSPALQNDPEVVLIAVKENCWAIYYV
ncbi:DUF4116 domain-containing protein [uncultured Fusobacterium sp.]|nr:DUF4116 domain-containing protein [uncultured Fusobacterium sp.]